MKLSCFFFRFFQIFSVKIKCCIYICEYSIFNLPNFSPFYVFFGKIHFGLASNKNSFFGTRNLAALPDTFSFSLSLAPTLSLALSVMPACLLLIIFFRWQIFTSGFRVHGLVNNNNFQAMNASGIRNTPAPHPPPSSR